VEGSDGAETLCGSCKMSIADSSDRVKSRLLGYLKTEAISEFSKSFLPF